MRDINRRQTGLQHEAQQPGLTTEADVKSRMKSSKRTEGAAADRVKHEDSSELTSFGMMAESLPMTPEIYIGDTLVDKGAGAPKPCLSLVEMHTSTAACGLLPAGTASTAMRTIFTPTPLLRSLCPTE